MSTKTELPKEILERAVNLRNAVRTIFLTLATAGKPLTADDLAKMVKHERAYVNMRLNQLDDMGFVKFTRSGKEKYYEVVQ